MEGVNKTPSFSAITLSGKTLVAYKEKDNGKPSICFTFNADRSVKSVMKKSGTIKTVTASEANWQVVNGKLKFFTEKPKYEIWTLMDENSGLFTYKQEWYNGDGSIDDSDTRTFRVLESCPTSEFVDD